MSYPTSKIILSLFIIGISVGCASTPVTPVVQQVHTFDGVKMGLDEVAVLKQGTMNTGFKVSFASVMRGIASNTRKFNKTRRAGGEHPSELYLKPDRYIVMVKCTGPDSHAFPAVPVTVTAGMTYEIECSAVHGSGGQIRGKISYVSSTDTDSR